MSLSWPNTKTSQNQSQYRWRGGAIGGSSDLGFESRLGTIAQWPWESYLHLCASVAK